MRGQVPSSDIAQESATLGQATSIETFGLHRASSLTVRCRIRKALV